MFQKLPASRQKLLRLHHLSRQERCQIRARASQSLASNPLFLCLDSRLQKQILSSASLAAAWQVLLDKEPRCSELRQAQDRLQEKGRLDLSAKQANPLLRFPVKNAPLAPELLLLGAAEELYFSDSARNHLRKISPLQPASAFLVPGKIWDELFVPKKLLGLWDPRSELIFLRAEAEGKDHLLLHEMIHSLQGAGQRYGATYSRERSILLEGITEEAAVLLDGQECCFYQKERAVATSLLQAADRSIEDLVFLSGDQMFLFLCHELGQTEKELAAWIKKQSFAGPPASLHENDYQGHREKSLDVQRDHLLLPPLV